MSDPESPNFALLRDCLSTALVRAEPASAPKPKRRRRAKNPASAAASSGTSGTSGSGPAVSSGPAPGDTAEDPLDPDRAADELADFIDYLANDIFDALPTDLQQLDLASWRDSPTLQAQYSLPLTTSSLSDLDLAPSTTDTLRTYHLISPDPTLDSPLPSTPEAFLLPILTTYITTLTTPPPASSASRADACEICARWWIPLSYHHLIPRFVHDKAVRRGWHRREDLQNVAWLCGACHRFVHQFRGHEDLARDYYTVDRLLEADEVQRWAAWVGRLRWKGGRGCKR